ncbi:four helix bundle protein [Muricauda sp. 2012CJ35-5]|uniref:Four helix bundle protein n=1 Tax=Flagellimonas spongiicola TaxID=2942208 RepID=A0ABT0PRY2_9FLAO|nr:four helix bundle protein [Allomuricauda spongiicola]MCL6274155.1 four helix bundle protein [Allomuricauda spongiicola]
MGHKKFDLEERFVHLAANIALFCKELPSDFTGQYYGNQLLRSGGSAALNFGEVQRAYSVKDYCHKASLVLKELKESRVNLKILNKICYGSEKNRSKLLDEIEQLIKIIAAIIRSKTR